MKHTMSESDAISTLITSQAAVGLRGQTAVQNAVLLNRTAGQCPFSFAVDISCGSLAAQRADCGPGWYRTV